MDSLPARLFISFVLLMLTTLFRYAQSAVYEANEARFTKLADENEALEKKCNWICEHKAQIHSTVQFINLLFTTALVIYVFELFHIRIDGYVTLSQIASVLLADLVILIFAIYTPSRVAKQKSEQKALSMYGLLQISVLLLTPIIKLSQAISKGMLRIFRFNPDLDEEITEEEILMMVDIGSSSGAIDPEEKEMINNIFEFDDTPAKEIMTHRTDVEFLWLEDDISAWDDAMQETNHTLYPVCDNDVDNIVGIVASKDFYRMLRYGCKDVHSIMKEPFFVPESIKADELFRQMQKNKTHFAMVLDEYGGLGGIITISDLLEEIVGNLSNEDDIEEAEIVRLDDNTWRILGSCDIDTVAESLDIELPNEEYNTFAGMIIDSLGKIPEDGSTPSLEAYGLSIKVLKVEDHRIELVKVAKLD